MKAKASHENKENEIWKDKYLRALADYQNLERRIIEEKKNDKKIAAKEIITKSEESDNEAENEQFIGRTLQE